MKVLITKEFKDDDFKYIKDGVNTHIQLIIPKSFQTNEIDEAFRRHKPKIVLGSYYHPDFLQEDELKLLQLPWNGYDSLDLTPFNHSHVSFANSRGSSSFIADFTLALFLNGVMKISYFDRFSKSQYSSDLDLTDERFYSSLRDLKVALFGYGSIGKSLHQKFRMLGADLDIYAKQERWEKDIHIRSLDSVILQNYDAIVITLPKNSETINLIGGQIPIANLRNDAVIINVGRTSTISESEVIADLLNVRSRRQWISDVFSKQFMNDSIVSSSARVLISPYRAGWVKGRKPHLDDAIYNINALYSGEPLINIIK